MKCNYCSKEIYGMTGLQELQKFQKHLRTCKKAPYKNVDMGEALELRHNSDRDRALEKL